MANAIYCLYKKNLPSLVLLLYRITAIWTNGVGGIRKRKKYILAGLKYFVIVNVLVRFGFDSNTVKYRYIVIGPRLAQVILSLNPFKSLFITPSRSLLCVTCILQHSTILYTYIILPCTPPTTCFMNPTEDRLKLVWIEFLLSHFYFKYSFILFTEQ